MVYGAKELDPVPRDLGVVDSYEKHMIEKLSLPEKDDSTTHEI